MKKPLSALSCRTCCGIQSCGMARPRNECGVTTCYITHQLLQICLWGSLLLAVGNAYANDLYCIRNNCQGTCISKEEAMKNTLKPMQMTCNPEYRCYQDVDCEKLDSGKCGWVETADLKKCLAEKSPSSK